MSKGHTIPLLQLTHLLHRRAAAITIFTTPANHPFISQSLPSGADISIVDLPFPTNIPEIPDGTESTDKLPSMSLFIPFVNGTKLMQPSFEKALGAFHKQVSCIISDGFLYWTLQSASKFGIPRLSFYGMSYYAMALSRAVFVDGSLSLHDSGDEEFTVTSFPWIKLCRNDFDDPFDKKDPRGPHLDFIIEATTATANSFGILVNSFYELEKPFADHWAREGQPKAWTVGPLCLESPPRVESGQKPKWIQWLDKKWAEGCSPVLYVAFGSQANISPAQLREIAHGLEHSKTRFLWVVRASKGAEFINDLEERVKERGIIVNEWVDQREILEHPIVQGFLSHCGWNSVLEGICAQVPILAWPMMAEQFINAKFVTEEIKVGLRVNTVDGFRKGFVTGESLKSTVIELMEGETGKKLRVNVREVAEAARISVADGGSSWRDLNRLIEETHAQKELNTL
ncbi:UDP-glycosyltransferase 90a1 [Phtheirospermum japonicum]|uniref:Glycosyltransferase n=1 Tax=Phtheirospermum japonicum TaxID=374723 RepID=A0A830D048_9LAMI|nr:UDP-glycosyltransferase 90a1 [Phtheirospermum japonicum]